ncbi:hypothetical protein EHS25_004191 [Saitozyma podzolica]|uniref:Uncharacterized protein n=1 Tax=Saitozyma podzolica TaxID=1890683 RepID=A0A427YTB3_9TREE|nr:hypothetical protein EHS25_004191 [Saitozyma podzolica]
MRDMEVSPSTSGELDAQQSRRPSIQTRRSWTRDADLVAPPAEPLHFDRKEWEQTPPLPLPPVSGHQQNAFNLPFGNVIAPSNGDHASSLAIAESPLLGLSGHPRSSSAPAGARSPKDALPSTETHPAANRLACRDRPPSSRHITVKANPTSNVPAHADIVSVTHLAQAFNQVMTRPGPLDLSAYFAPDLAALLQEKLETNIASGKETRNAKEKPMCETEWSFALPKAEVLSRAILPFLEESYSGIVQIADQDAMGFSSFVFSEFGDVVFPPITVDIAIGWNDLGLLHGVVPHRSRHGSHGIEREALADRNLNDWLRARAQEIKPGGVIAFHCPIRMVASPPHQPAQSPSATTAASASFPPQPSSSSSIQGSPEMPLLALYDQQPPATPIPFLRANVPAEHPHRRTSRPGMWRAMYHAFLPAVQRLVSLGEIRPHVAPFLLDVPYWPRSLAGLAASIAKQLDWEVLRPDESGVTHLPPDEWEWLEAGVRVHHLTHPAWTDFEEGRIDRATYARRVAMFCRGVYEPHLKAVLREKGKMDVSQAETTLQELFKTLIEKCELGALDDLEMDTGVIVLKRL